MIAPISALYAGVFGLLFIGLTIPVVLKRRRLRIGLGAGQHIGFERTMRAQQNFAEYVPLALILLLTAEINGTGPGLLHAAAGTLLAGRVLHALGLSRYGGISFGRTWGTVLTWFAILVLAVANLYRVL